MSLNMSINNLSGLAQQMENSIQTDTLEVLGEAQNYNRRIMKTIAPYVGENTLEIGCGIGNFTQLLMEHSSHLTALDIVPEYARKTESQVIVPENKTLNSYCHNVFDDPEGVRAKGPEAGFDTIIMLNVLEHIEHDEHAVQTLHNLLAPGGRLILLVPAHQFLYSDYDRSIHHYRRYEHAGLNQLLVDNQFTLDYLQHFNFVGIFGWWVKFCLLKKTGMESNSVKLFDQLSPLFDVFESRIPLPLGLSLISVSQKRKK